MRELRSFGSVRDEGREVLVYSEFRCALLCLAGPNAAGAMRILSIKSELNFRLLRYEPGGREFECLRARQNFVVMRLRPFPIVPYGVFVALSGAEAQAFLYKQFVCN